MSRPPTVTTKQYREAADHLERARRAAIKAAAKAERAQRKAAKAEAKLAVLQRSVERPAYGSVVSDDSGDSGECRSTGEKRSADRATGRHVYLCRGCCCGKAKKHPGVDHDGIRRAVRDSARAAGLPVTVTDCLGPCGQGNMLVVQTDETVRWFRKMNEPGAVRDLVEHVGATGSVDGLPDAYDRHVMAKREGRQPRW